MCRAETVLVIDDDPDIVRGTSLRLKAAGFQTIHACDGAAGVAAAVDVRPDAILMDVRMPQMDGLTALHNMRERDETKDIPVIMLSASLIDRQAALKAGARFFLSKPYQADTLLAAIESALSETSDSSMQSRADAS